MPTTITPDAFTNIGHDTWHSLRNARTLPFSGITKKINGYWAPAASYNTQLAAVGASGVRARRIYGNLTSAGNDQSGQITAAISAGMIPVVSYKLGSTSIANAITGSADGDALATANYLASLNTLIYCVVYHEPYDNMDGPTYVSLCDRLVPIFAGASANIKMGTFNHGWLLDTPANTTVTKGYYSPTQLANGNFAWAGIDSYQTGTQASPGSILPGDRMPAFRQMVADLGYPNIPLGIGEWNGWTLAGIQSGIAFVNDPTTIFFCMWDSTSGVGLQLSGTRLAAYQAIKADARVLQ